MASWRHDQLFQLYLHNIPSPQKDLGNQEYLHLCPILYVVVFRVCVPRVFNFLNMTIVADCYYYYCIIIIIIIITIM